MGPLAAVERFLERLFERQAARLFKTGIRPIQVQRRLERAMEGTRIRDGARTLVPDRFVVRMTADDLASLRAVAPSLAADLADGALAFARSHGYALLDRPTVALRADPSISVGDIVVDASPPGGRGDRAGPGSDSFSEEEAGPAGDDRDVEDAANAAGRDRPPGAGSAAPPVASPFPGGARSSDQTAVFVVPSSEGPRAILRETRPDGSSRTIAFDGRPLTIGRAPDNRLVVRDGRASRHHARIDGRRGSLILSDLGSTNGSFVNDRRVESVALGAGDRIRIGTTALIVETVGRDVPAGEEDQVAPSAESPATGTPAQSSVRSRHPRDAPPEPPPTFDGRPAPPAHG